jgi:O-antigen/teichoic acid export membrane protein
LERVLSYIRGKLQNQTVQEILETFGSRVVSLGIKIVNSIIVARALGPDGKGVLALATVVLNLGTQFGSVSVNSSNAYYASQKPEWRGRLYGNTLVIFLFWAFQSHSRFWGLFSVAPDIAPVQGWILLIALAMIPVRVSISLSRSLLVGMQDFRSNNLIDPIEETVVTALILGVIVLGFVKPVVFLGMNMLVAILILGWVSIRLNGKIKGAVTVSWEVLQSSISYGERAFLASLSSFLVIRVDVLLIGSLKGATAVGYYSLASSIIMYMYIFPVSVSTVLFPKMSEMDETNERRHTVLRAVLYVGLLTTGVAIVAYFVGDRFITFIYGAQFSGSIPPFLWLLPALVILSVNTLFQNYFASEGLPWVAVVSPLAGIALNVPLNFYLIPQFGIVGTAIASVLSYALMLVVSVSYILISAKSTEPTHSKGNSPPQEYGYLSVCTSPHWFAPFSALSKSCCEVILLPPIRDV